MSFSGTLKQSTAVTIKFGPCLADDGTLATGLDIDAADVLLSKAGGNYAAKNDATDNAAEDGAIDGVYLITLNTTDTNTVGILDIIIAETGMVAKKQTYIVQPANIFDAGAGSDLQQVHTAEITAGLITSTVLADNAITAAKINADAITAAKVAADVTTEIQSGLATAAELAKVPKSDSNVTFNATALASIQQEATDALNAYDPPTKAELDSGLDALPTAAENAAEILSEAASTPIEANIKEINDVAITGTGTLGTEWDAA